MDEVEYLKSTGVLVTSTRIEINGQTFAVRNVGSVKVTKPGAPWFAACVGVLIAFTAIAAQAWFGLLFAAGAAAWVWQQLRTRRLVLVSGGGEAVALASTNKAAVEAVRSAIAQSIATR